MLSYRTKHLTLLKFVFLPSSTASAKKISSKVNNLKQPRIGDLLNSSQLLCKATEFLQKLSKGYKYLCI